MAPLRRSTVSLLGRDPPRSGPDGETRFNVREALLTETATHHDRSARDSPRKKSEVWLQLRPGTDDALGLAFLNVIIEEDLYDHDFCEKYTHGFKELAERVHKFTPEWAEPITWVPAGQDPGGRAPLRDGQARDAPVGLCDRAHAEHDSDDPRAVDSARRSQRGSTCPAVGFLRMHGAGRFPSLIENLDSEVEKKRLGYEKYKMLCGEGADLPACHIPTLINAMLIRRALYASPRFSCSATTR